MAPWLAALGVITGLVTKCRVEVEREPGGNIEGMDSDSFGKRNAN